MQQGSEVLESEGAGDLMKIMIEAEGIHPLLEGLKATIVELEKQRGEIVKGERKEYDSFRFDSVVYANDSSVSVRGLVEL